jgi:hypothetical protein
MAVLVQPFTLLSSTRRESGEMLHSRVFPCGGKRDLRIEILALPPKRFSILSPCSLLWQLLSPSPCARRWEIDILMSKKSDFKAKKKVFAAMKINHRES